VGVRGGAYIAGFSGVLGGIFRSSRRGAPTSGVLGGVFRSSRRGAYMKGFSGVLGGVFRSSRWRPAAGGCVELGCAVDCCAALAYFLATCYSF